MHNDPRNNLKFRVRRRISKTSSRENRYRRTSESVTEMVAVDDPSKSPEAFDGRCVLRHMRSAYREYAAALEYRSSSDFKNLLATIIYRAPKKRNSSFTWRELDHTLLHMRWLIEGAIEGLENTDQFTLADKVRWGLNELKDITESAKWVQVQLSR